MIAIPAIPMEHARHAALPKILGLWTRQLCGVFHYKNTSIT